MGIAIEAIGTVRLEKLAPTLDAKQCREAAAALESSDAGREPETTVLERDRAWSRRVYGWRWQIARLVMFKSLRKMDKQAVGRLNAHRARERTLLIQLAARAYELETGKRRKEPCRPGPRLSKGHPPKPDHRH